MRAPKDMERGVIHQMKSGPLEIIEYFGAYKVKAAFAKTGFEVESTSTDIRLGRVKDPLSVSVEGVGIIGKGPHKSSSKSERSNAYSAWREMLARCYKESVRSKYPSYAECTVCDEWHNFQVFASWYEKQPKSFGYQLDKDILGCGAKIYSPERCMLIPQWINVFIVNNKASRGELMIGVSYDKVRRKYRSSCSSVTTKYLGLFGAEIEAHNEWKRYKLSLARSGKLEMDAVDERIYPNVVRIINEAT